MGRRLEFVAAVTLTQPAPTSRLSQLSLLIDFHNPISTLLTFYSHTSETFGPAPLFHVWHNSSTVSDYNLHVWNPALTSGLAVHSQASQTCLSTPTTGTTPVPHSFVPTPISKSSHSICLRHNLSLSNFSKLLFDSLWMIDLPTPWQV